jgi:serine/threonine protein kinase
MPRIPLVHQVIWVSLLYTHIFIKTKIRLRDINYFNLAPEVMCRQNHGVAVDYFAVGVIGYECMYGKRPYIGKNRKEIRDHILSKQV